MSETTKSSHWFPARLLTFGLGMTLVAGCSGESIKGPEPSSTTLTHSVESPPKPPSVSQVEQVRRYIDSPSRNQRIATAAHAFGAQVLAASKNHSNVWAPFDAFCTKPKGPFNDSNWTSKGYIPKAGDECFVQHNPQYGGGQLQIGAQVVVGPGGNYSGTFTAVMINSKQCPAVFANDVAGIWDVTKGGKDYEAYETAADAKTLKAAKMIDNFVVSCLNETTYK